MALNGYDISNYQSTLSIANVSCDFVIIKATQGFSYYNPSFEKHINEAISLGKLIGVYHYVSETDYKKEADFFISKIKDYIGSVLICVDWEGIANKSWGNGVYIANFLDYLYDTIKVKPIIYMSKSTTRHQYWNLVPNKYELWSAQYASYDKITNYLTTPWTDTKGYGLFKKPIIHQYTSRGYLKGYNNLLDLDICYLSKEEWNKRCKVEKPNKTIYRVTANTLNIRSEPSALSKDIGDLRKDSIIRVDKIENGFAHFEGWCSLKYLN